MLSMPAPTRTIVSFKSTAFNTSEDKTYFINTGCVGDDVAEWLIKELGNQGVNADPKPGQEDFGWYFNFQVAGKTHTLVIVFRPEDTRGRGTWIGVIERRRGLIGSLFGRRKHGIDALAAQTLHSILSVSPQVQDIRWHFEHTFLKGHEELGASAP